MELRQYWEILRRKWWIPVLLALFTALLSAWQLQPWQRPAPTYTSTIRMLIGVNPLPSSDETAFDPRYYAWLASEYLVDDFTEVVRSALFAENVSQRLASQNIVVPANVIQGSAVSAKQHRIITVSFQWPDRLQLEAIANAVTAELNENAPFYFQQLGSDGSVATVIDPPTIGEVQQGVRSQIEFPLRVILGFIIGLGIIFFWDYLDLSIRNREELEEIGLTVLGEIPKHR